MGEAFLTPTRIYVKPLLKALKLGGIKGMAHITGGGLSENIPRVLPENAAVRLDARNWPKPPVFAWLAQAGNLEAADMARTLNCGIGMVIIVAAAEAAKIRESLESDGESVHDIGRVTTRDGQDGPQVVIDNIEALSAASA